MSVSSAGAISAGTVSAQFVLDASGATSVIQTINQSAAQIKNAFGNVTFKLDASQAQSAIQQLATATTAYKAAQTQATQALADQRTALTSTKTALDAARTATEQQRTATEAARTASAQATADLKQLQLATKQAADEAKNAGSAFSAMGAVLQGIGQAVGRTVFEAVGAGLKGLGDAAIGMNANLQQSAVAFTALTGSASTAQDMVGKLETLAAHSTFGLAQLQQSAQQMLAFGVATQNVPPLLQAVQTAAAASGGDINDKFQRISYVLSELSSGMNLSERQLRQLAMAGVPLKDIADQLGITVEQLQQAGKTGQVTGEQVVAAFQKVYTEGRFGDFMQQQTQTFSGAMNVIRTNVQLAGAEAFKPLFDVVSQLAVTIATFVQTATFTQWVANLRAAVAAAVEVLQTFGQVLAPIGSALAKLFGFDTANIGAEMDAVKNATVDVGTYDASLQGAGKSADGTKEQLAGFKGQVAEAQQALIPLTDELNRNKQALDANAVAIANVKATYAPQIRGAQENIARIHQLTPDELARKQNELALEKQKTTLELTKPDTTSFDAAILQDRTNLQNLPRVNTESWDTTIKADDTKLRDFNEKAYTAPFDAQIKGYDTQLRDFDPKTFTAPIDQALAALKDVDVKGPFDAKIHEAQDAIAHLDPQAATQPITDTIQGIKDRIAALDPQAATQGITDTIQAIQDHIASLDPQAATQKFTDTIASIQDRMAALDPEAATAGITNQIAGIQHQIGALNTDELDDKINRLKDALNAPPPNTQGLKNQLVALAAQIEATTDVATRANLESQFATISAQKDRIEQGYQTTQASGKRELVGLESQKRDATDANNETRKGLETQKAALTEQAKIIREGIADQKKADEERIRDLNRQKQAVAEGIADQKKADEERIRDLNRQKQAVAEGIADAKKADEDRIRELNRQKQAVTEGIADQKKADEERVRDLERQKQAVTAGIADQRKGYETTIREQERLRTDAEADHQKKLSDLQEERTHAEAQAAQARKQIEDDRARAQKNREDAVARAQVDRKKIEDDRAAAQQAKSDAVEIDRLVRQGLDDRIKRNESLKANALVQYNQQLAAIIAQQQHNSLLDAQAAAQRKLDLAPYQAQLEKATQAEKDALEPLDDAKTKLDEARAKIQENIATQNENKRVAEAGAAALKNQAAEAGGLGDTLKMAGDNLKKGLADPAAVGPDSPLVTWLHGVRDDILALVASDGWKQFWSPDTSIWGKAALLGGSIVGGLDTALQGWLGSHANGFVYEMIYGKTKAPGGIGPDAPVDVTTQLQDLFDKVNTFFLDHPMLSKAWHDWLNQPGFGQAIDNLITESDGDLQKPGRWYQSNTMNPIAWGQWLRHEALAAAMSNFITESDGDLHKPERWYNDNQMTPIGWGAWLAHTSFGAGMKQWINDAGSALLNPEKWFGDNPMLPEQWGMWLHQVAFGQAMDSHMAGIAPDLGKLNDWFKNHQHTKEGWLYYLNGAAMKDAVDAVFKAAFAGVPGAIAASMRNDLALVNNLGRDVVGAITAIGNFFGKDMGALKWQDIGTPNAADNPDNRTDGPNTPVPSSGGGGAEQRARGDLNFRGGPAIIGEAGRELYHDGSAWGMANQATLLNLPRGATVLPNHITEAVLSSGVPGFAGGLAGDLLNGVKTLAGDALTLGRQGASAVYDKVVGALPDMSGVRGGMQPILAGTAAMAKTELRNLIGAALPKALPAIKAIGTTLFGAPTIPGASGVPSMEAIHGLLAMESSLHGIPLDLLAAIVLQESSGVIGRVQDGGGLGRGLMQVDLGQNPNYDEARLTGTTMDDARYQIESGIEILLRNAPADWGNHDQVWEALYHYNGGTDYPDIIFGLERRFASWLRDAGASGDTTPPGSWGDYGAVVTEAMKHLGETTMPSGISWNGWCEKFQNDMDDAAGFGSYRAGTAYFGGLHARETGALHPDASPPAGASIWFDQSWGGPGHAAIATGSGTTAISTPIADGHNDIHYADIVGAPGYMGWAPPGMADGAYVTGPTHAIVGEGKAPEFVLPEPKLDAALAAAVRGGGGGVGNIILHMEPGAITVDRDGLATVDVRKIAVEAVNAELYEHTGLRGR